MTLIVVAGIPASGKTTLVRDLGPALGLSVVSKDVIKESLMDTLGSGDADWARELGRAAFGIMYAVLDDLVGDVIFEAHFHRGIAEATLEATGHDLVQVYCSCPPEVAWERYQRRRDEPTRHPGHHPEHQDEMATAEWRDQPPEPLDLDGPLIVVDTTRPVDIAALTSQVDDARRGKNAD